LNLVVSSHPGRVSSSRSSAQIAHRLISSHRVLKSIAEKFISSPGNLYLPSQNASCVRYGRVLALEELLDEIRSVPSVYEATVVSRSGMHIAGDAPKGVHPRDLCCHVGHPLWCRRDSNSRVEGQAAICVHRVDERQDASSECWAPELSSLSLRQKTCPPQTSRTRSRRSRRRSARESSRIYNRLKLPFIHSKRVSVEYTIPSDMICCALLLEPFRA